MGDRSKRTHPSLDGYRFHRLLGRGGMGEVWLATDVTLGRQVAVKLIRQELADDPEFADRFFNEMKTVAKFRHPNIGRVYGTQRSSDGRLAMIMELLEGESLRQVLDTQPPSEPFDIVRAAFFTIQVLEAVQEAHEQGIQHRDIKPENVITHEDGHVWLVDFGVATRRQITGEIGKKKAETPKQSAVLGTARYMAPELIEHGRSDNRSDLYSVGVMLYHTLTGDFPHPGIDDNNETGILAAHVHLEPTPISELRKDCEGAIDTIVSKLLAKNPDHRYQSAEEAITDLSMLVRGSLPPDDPIAKKLLRDREQKARKAAFAKHVARAEASRHTQISGFGEDTPVEARASTDREARIPQPTKRLPPDFVAPSPTSHSTDVQEAWGNERSTVPMGAPGTTSVSSPCFIDNNNPNGRATYPAAGTEAPAHQAPAPAAPVATSSPVLTATRPGAAVASVVQAPALGSGVAVKPIAAPVVRAGASTPGSSAPTALLTAPRALPATPRPSAPSTSSTNPGWERERPGAAREEPISSAATPYVRQLAAAVSIGVALAVGLAVVLFRGRWSATMSATMSDAGQLAATTASARSHTEEPAPPASEGTSLATPPASAIPPVATTPGEPPPPAAPSAPTLAQVEVPRRMAPRSPTPSAAPRGQSSSKPTSPAPQPAAPESQKKPEAPVATTAPHRMFGTDQ
ncbi:Serine/threonine protein kinase PrkC, regulator of stationary phase [Minicystis rosea]|nr:Serine/threonine protein kinase PrkC, regulator of stationary phase [Minicystis rosea]